MTLQFFIFNCVEKNLGKDQNIKILQIKVFLSYHVEEISVDSHKKSKLSPKNAVQNPVPNPSTRFNPREREDFDPEEDRTVKDDLRHLKDFKTMIGEKKTSKKVKILNAFMILLMLIIFSLALTKTIFKNIF